MKSYLDLIEQTFFFPTPEFKVENNELLFNDIPLMPIIEEYGTPLKLTYLPKISEKIRYAQQIFQTAIEKYNYNKDYIYCYCTKSSHFKFVLEEALASGTHMETSSAFDIPIAKHLYASGKLTKEHFIICNGFKTEPYKQYIKEIIEDGFNCVPILDNMKEIEAYQDINAPVINLGIRIALDEEPKFEFYTSRLGIRYNDIVNFYKESIATHPTFKLKMLHFFVNTGIKDTAYYWSEFSRFVYKYCELKKICPDLDIIDIGGGFPIKTSVHFDYNYAYMAEEIVKNIKLICDKNGVEVPRIFTEFGSYTVGESGAIIYSVLEQKQQNDKECWYMIDGSLITQLPDIWGLNQKYIILAVNNWDNTHQRINIGGITCDSMDYYSSEAHINAVFMPNFEPQEKQYIGFFHTGAYQESLGGYGGIQHCLIPAPKHVIIDKNEQGEISTRLFAPQQDKESMLRILGYMQ